MRYLGSKRNLISDIQSVLISKNLLTTSPTPLTFLDIFAGTNTVSRNMKPYFKVVTNDNLFFSYAIAKGEIVQNDMPCFDFIIKKLGCHPIDYFNTMHVPILKKGFISSHYCANNTERMFFTKINARKIDVIRNSLDIWLNEGYINERAYFYLLASLIEAVPFVSNISGVYSAYLKSWDKRALNPLLLKHPVLIDNHQNNIAHNLDANQLVRQVTADIAYIDPPYNGRQYLSNYHLLETIALNDSPAIEGVAGIRLDQQKNSDYCKKTKALTAFEDLIENLSTTHTLMSYSSDGIIPKKTIIDVLAAFNNPNSIELIEIPYRKYKSKINNNSPVVEYLFYAHK